VSSLKAEFELKERTPPSLEKKNLVTMFTFIHYNPKEGSDAQEREGKEEDEQ
jgi:hypothetical protein